MCSIVLAHSLEDTYNLMKATQNRGKDSAGIAAVIKEKAIEKFGKPVNAEVEVRYMDIEPLLEVFESFGLTREELCTYCIGGAHPFK